MTISFWGSTTFSLEILKAVRALDEVNVAYVVTQSAKPFGRKQELKHNPVAQYCLDNDVLLFTQKKDILHKYETSSLEPTQEKIQDKKFHTDLALVAAYGKILSQNILKSAHFGFINFHGSLLPQYRGAVPVQMTVMNQNYSAAGITIIKMDEGMDTGAIITSIPLETKNDYTSGELMQELASLASNKITHNPALLLNPEKWQLTVQDESQATTCFIKDFEKKDVEINFMDGVNLTHGKIMAANPEPKAWIDREALSLRSVFSKINILRSRIPDSELMLNINNKLSFHISSDKKLYLELSDGFLEILEIQPEGKNIMDARSFINGFREVIARSV